MIEFDSLQDGLYYYTKCPLCGYHMQIDGVDQSFGIGNNRGYTITFLLDGDDTLIINPVSEEIIVTYQRSIVAEEKNNKSYIYNPRSSTFNTYNGTAHYGLNIGCAKGGCRNFSYVLRITIDMNQLKLQAVALSIIRVLMKDGVDTCEITNYFARNLTMYGHTNSVGKFMELPMVDINLKNPQETLSRIKKLVIFA